MAVVFWVLSVHDVSAKMHLGRWNSRTGSHSHSWFLFLAYLIFYNCDVSLRSHNCFPIWPVFHQHLNSHIAYRGSPLEPSNQTREQFLYLPSYLPLRLLWLKPDNKVTRKRAVIHLFVWALTGFVYGNLLCWGANFDILVQNL